MDECCACWPAVLSGPLVFAGPGRRHGKGDARSGRYSETVAEQHGTRRYRVYQGIGMGLGVLFLAIGVGALLAGGGPIVAIIGIVGGVLCLTASIITMVRS
jgi:hypothetical protein